MESKEQQVRLDKWLWAARFFKTRALAQDAINGGKVQYNNARVKPSREVQVGAVISIQQGNIRKQIIVVGLNSQRRSATEAALLYEETEESKQARAKQAEERRLLHESGVIFPTKRPDKKQRRQIIRFIKKPD